MPLQLFYSQLLKRFSEIKHFFSSRIGGFSPPPFQYANMSLIVGDEFALKNRFLLSAELKVDLHRFVFMQQVHADGIKIVDKTQAGKGAFTYVSAVPQTDALITAHKGLMLTVTTADCVPILLFDRKNKVIAAVHSGWRGTVRKIVAKTIEQMRQSFGSQPQDIFAAIGPSIGACCYQVGHDVENAVVGSFGTRDFLQYRPQGIYFDLWAANQFLLMEQGIPKSQIDLLAICTSCHNERFFSARKADKGRQLAGIMLM